MKKLIITAITALTLAAPVAFSAGGGATYPNDHANINLADKESLQNGAKLFINYCAGCHSMEYVRYSRIAQDLGLSEEQVMENLVLGDQKFGETLKKSMNPKLAKKWFGVDPLDLTLAARVRGEDWLYNYLRSFYKDSSRPFGVNNTVFPDVGMPHVLADLQGTQELSEDWVSVEAAIHEAKNIIANAEASEQQKAEANSKLHEAEAMKSELSQDGKIFVQTAKGSMTPEDYDHNIRDLVAFMAYTANPVKLQSKSMGIWAILFLVLLLIPAYFMKKEFWKDVH
ncbi:cytochrome c1 [Kangiella sp. TOML190]|uniref:cytochrome c1 n=1 Tax=Kangiella sp. TOML190 TaxID=2931351 RepID=UPI002041C622|nr:cytochrome c1 [Kangiella sp. TOML190]